MACSGRQAYLSQGLYAVSQPRSNKRTCSRRKGRAPPKPRPGTGERWPPKIIQSARTQTVVAASKKRATTAARNVRRRQRATPRARIATAAMPGAGRSRAQPKFKSATDPPRLSSKSSSPCAPVFLRVLCGLFQICFDFTLSCAFAFCRAALAF